MRLPARLSLLLVELVINSYILLVIDISPFYLGHGYNLSPFTPTEEEQLVEEPAKSPIQKGEAIVWCGFIEVVM